MKGGMNLIEVIIPLFIPPVFRGLPSEWENVWIDTYNYNHGKEAREFIIQAVVEDKIDIMNNLDNNIRQLLKDGVFEELYRLIPPESLNIYQYNTYPPNLPPKWNEMWDYTFERNWGKQIRPLIVKAINEKLINMMDVKSILREEFEIDYYDLKDIIKIGINEDDGVKDKNGTIYTVKKYPPKLPLNPEWQYYWNNTFNVNNTIDKYKRGFIIKLIDENMIDIVDIKDGNIVKQYNMIKTYRNIMTCLLCNSKEVYEIPNNVWYNIYSFIS